MIESTVSNLVKNQFPDFYLEEGPVFVAFVQKYFEWLETSASVANQTFEESMKHCGISVIAGNNEITTSNAMANLNECISNGDTIAIYTKSDGSDYNLYTVNTVTNATHLTITSTPDFSLTNTRFSLTKTQKNPLKYSRDYYNDLDVDTTSEEFLVYFKEKYLKNIQFDTSVNLRRLIKHALDIYRSKGTERSADLLFKIVFGVGAKFYYPGDDVFRLSDGHWYTPKYLEVSLRESNSQLVNKQIYGYKSGATAFVESVVRKTAGGQLIDVLYISAINGEFETGELINSSGNVLENNDRPVITGSLTSLEISNANPGSAFSVGDILDISSTYGSGGKARVANTSNNIGVVSIELNDGGYAYSNNAEVLVSENVLTLDNLIIPATHSTTTNSYFELFSTIYQDTAVINYTNASATFSNNDHIYTYHANNDLKGEAKILSASGNTTNGTLTVSILSGNVDNDPFYTASNAEVSNVITYTDTSASGNVFAYSNTANLFLITKSGTFATNEIVYQTDGGGARVASAKYVSYNSTVGSNGVLALANVSGVFRNDLIITGNTSGATGNVQYQKLNVGIKDVLGSFISTTNNNAYILNATASISFVSAGAQLEFGISPTLTYAEDVSLNSDYVLDYLNLPLTHTALTGTVAINTTSNVCIGTGTDFENEIGYTLTGDVSVNTTANTVTGNGTLFSTEISAGDICICNNQSVRVRSIVNNTFMYVNSAFAFTASGETLTKNQYVIFTDGSAGNTVARQVLAITNSTHMTTDGNGAFDDTNATMTLSWAFPGNTAANLTFGALNDILSNSTVTIGRINSLTGVNRGTGYDISPFVRVFEPLTYGAGKYDRINVAVSSISTSFANGDVITQEATEARGIITFANTSTLTIDRLRFVNSNNFVLTTNSTTTIVSEASGATANIDSIEVLNIETMGLNANIGSDVIIANGALSNIEVIVSGFGFKDGEEVTLSSGENIVTVTARLGKFGKGTSFYKQKGGFLSDQKKLFDGLYYQDYSYEVRSSVTLNKYEEMLKQLLHVAGTKYYGAFVFDTEANSNISVESSTVTQS